MINHDLLDSNFISDADEPVVVIVERSYLLKQHIADDINELLAEDNIQLIELHQLYRGQFNSKKNHKRTLLKQ
jgi:hypothetical protein